MANNAETDSRLSEEFRHIMEVDLDKLENPVLARLIREVRLEADTATSSYSRFHNRHNRSR